MYALIRETTLLFIVTFLFGIQFRANYLTKQKLKDYVIFFWTYFGLQIVYSIFGILNIIHKILILVIKFVKKKLR